MDKVSVPNNIFVILGPARSGTSSITRALKALGVDLGNKLTHPSKSVNPTGFWEDNEIVYKINREIFSQLNCILNGVTLLDGKILRGDALNSLKQSAISLVKQRFNTTTSWGFKDPQTSRLIPFWQSVFASLNLNEHYVIALRNPLSSAQSHHNLSGADIRTGLLLWLMHIAPAIQETTGKNRVIISYENLMKNPKHQLDRLQKMLKIASTSQDADVNQYIHEFLDKKLYRNQFSYDNLKSHPAMQLFPLCLKTYDLLLRVAHDEISFEDAEFKNEWQHIWNLINEQQLLHDYIDSLLNKNNVVEKKLRYIQHSRVWKIMYPLRVIQDGMHTYHAKKNKKIRY